MDDNKLICDECGADLREVGVWTKNIVTYKHDGDNSFSAKEIEFDDSHGVYCNNCNEALNSEVISEMGFEQIIL